MPKSISNGSTVPAEPSPIASTLKRAAIVFAVKPITIIYAMSFSVTNTVNSQLWLDKTCRNNLKFSDDICKNLRLPEYQSYNDKVQAQVNDYQIVQTYLEIVPMVIAALFLGPLSDKGRKRVLVIPFCGHIISGICSLLNVYFFDWDARFLWLQELYVFFGGFTVLNIAMVGYIGDVTKVTERTALMSILSGLTACMFPLADFAGGQIFVHYGYIPVYWTSFGFIILGIVYIQFIPESVKLEQKVEESEGGGAIQYIKDTSKLWVSTFKSTFRKRETGERKIMIVIFCLGLLGSLRGGGNSLLYTQKKFGWTVNDYSYYNFFSIVHVGVKSLIFVPFLCYYLQVHDCMLGILGSLSGMEEYLVFAFATKGWMMYYASALSIIGGSTRTPETALLSKCVPSSDLGKVFTMFGVAHLFVEFGTSTLMKLVYNATLETFLGATYCISAGQTLINMFVMLYLYKMVYKNEQKFGPLGTRDEEEKEQ